MIFKYLIYYLKINNNKQDNYAHNYLIKFNSDVKKQLNSDKSLPFMSMSLVLEYLNLKLLKVKIAWKN